MIEVSQEQAQRFILDVQGLRTEKPSVSLLKVARRIHNIQIVIYTKYITFRNYVV